MEAGVFIITVVRADLSDLLKATGKKELVNSLLG